MSGWCQSGGSVGTDHHCNRICGQFKYSLVAKKLAVGYCELPQAPAHECSRMLSRTGMKLNRGCWKFDEQAKALYIDIEEDEHDSSKEYSCWDQTPDILLEEIFSYLDMRERYYASLVCRSWYRAFKLQNVWARFTLEDNTLTRGKYNYYSGWQYVLDHIRTSTCLNKVGKNFRSLTFEPMLNFYNLYEFMNMFSWYTEKQGCDNLSVAGVGTHVRHLKFTFPCNMANSDDPERVKLFGTGGKLLEALKKLVANLRNLRCLELIDLMLDSREALHLLDDLCTNNSEKLQKLVLINATRYYCPLIHIGVFLNLKVLVVSPQSIDEDVLELIGYTKLRHLHILQNRYSPVDATIQLPKSAAWSKMRRNNAQLRVHFEVECNKPMNVMLPIDFSDDSAVPCHSIVLDNPTVQVSSATIMTHGAHFSSTLRVYAVKGLSRYYLQKNFLKRLDEALVGLCKMCPNLHTLMIRDKVSTATILQIVTTAKSLRCLYVRRNVVLKRCDRDWSNITDWSAEHCHWIKINSRSYDSTEREVSRILGYRWHMLSEREFKNQIISLHI